MSEKRVMINEEELEKVSGGLIDMNYDTNIATFINPNNMSDVRTYKINPETFMDAWHYNCQRHEQQIPEETILQEMIDKGYFY